MIAIVAIHLKLLQKVNICESFRATEQPCNWTLFFGQKQELPTQKVNTLAPPSPAMPKVELRSPVKFHLGGFRKLLNTGNK
jgi:hypothetical protein